MADEAELRRRPARVVRTLVLAGVIAAGLASMFRPAVAAVEPKKQYWATSLSGRVDEHILKGLYAAVAQGAVGWLDIDPTHPIPRLTAGINLIFYHVGGNCYVGDDCDRFPSSAPTRDRWSDTERVIDLEDPDVRKIVVNDLLAMVRRGDQIAPAGAIVGVHLDNVHRLGAEAIAEVFNDFLQAVEAARARGTISRSRQVGYVAKNNPSAFKQALDQGLLNALPLYQINENAKLSKEGSLDEESQRAQQIGRRYCVPVFLKTFGTDIAYTVEENDEKRDVYVSEEMTRQMAEMPYVSGAAWSVDEANYHPTLFVEGSPVAQEPGASGPCRSE